MKRTRTPKPTATRIRRKSPSGARREYEMALKLDSQLEQAREALENLG